MNYYAVISLVVLAMAVSTGPSSAAFGGKPPLGPKDSLRRELAPYDLVKLNYLGMNYCENLLDVRTNIVSYTHLNSDTNAHDAWHLQFGDDTARLIEGIVWEDRFSPVVRLELARRLVKGIISQHLPGTRSYYSFRNRVGGKTFFIFDDSDSSKQGRLLLSNWGDNIEGLVKAGFRARNGSEWLEIDKFEYTDDPKGAGTPGVGRSPRYWNESPFVFKRNYVNQGKSVDFTGRYWLSDEDKPLEFGFRSSDYDEVQIVVGEPGKVMPLLSDVNVPGIIHLPDRTTTYNSNEDGSKTFINPEFNYFILRKQSTWACPGYSAALLVMWEGHPEKIEALADNGYSEIRLYYPKVEGVAGGKVMLLPFQWLNQDDMEYVYRNAEHFLRYGALIHSGLPTQQLVNAIPAGLAAGAYLLTKYNDPFAPTARIIAQNAVDQLFDDWEKGRWFIRAFFAVRSAAWMVKLSREMGDREMAAKYAVYLDQAMQKMLSPQVGYDGKGWGSGWDHFNCIKSLWLAYDATGKDEYLETYKRAQTLYSIDEKGIYREGKPLAAPGGFDTYSGSLALAVWGLDGKLDWCEKLINLDVPNGWHDPKLPVKDTWNDAGAGPWAQDDANPEYVGISLRGVNIPQKEKYVLPVGSFPVYDAKGGVEITGQPILDSPYFSGISEKVKVLKPGEKLMDYQTFEISLIPGDDVEKEHLVRETGRVENGRRICSGTDMPVIYRFDTRDMDGAGIDLQIEGRGYRIEVSPDGKRWYKRLDTWSDRPAWHSLDLSFLTGGGDELIKLYSITPMNDRRFIAARSEAEIERDSIRRMVNDGSVVYKLNLPQVTQCRLDFLVGNGYKVQCSTDGISWRDEFNAGQFDCIRDTDAAWLRALDISSYLKKSSNVYVRISNLNDPQKYDGKGAFIRRLNVYGSMDSPQVYVKISSAAADPGAPFIINRVIFRKWSR